MVTSALAGFWGGPKVKYIVYTLCHRESHLYSNCVLFPGLFKGCTPLEYLQSTAKQPALDSQKRDQPATEVTSLLSVGLRVVDILYRRKVIEPCGYLTLHPGPLYLATFTCMYSVVVA